jgi:hypothetical protein
MDLNKLIEIVDEGYPDGFVKRCFDNPKKDHGDTLALFLAREVKDTFDADATDEAQVAEAIRVMEMARRELGDVLVVLERVKFTKTGNAVR